jgi:hypothetical protein
VIDAERVDPMPGGNRPEGNRPGEDDGDRGPRVWDAVDLKASEQPRWLANGRLPRAAVSMLLGDEGIGKSLLWVLLVAHITTGKPFEGFGIPTREPGLVVLVITEDDWSTAVLPRLEAVGADLNMIKIICTEQDGSGSPVFPNNIELIDAIEPSPVLVVVDCWLDTVPAGKKVSDAQQARQVLHPWKESANRTGSAVLLLGHTNRMSSANPREKYGATYALRQKARMTLFAQLDDDGHLQVGPEKSNGAVILPASTFKVDTVSLFRPTDEHDGKVPFLTYVGESAKTAREHLADNYASNRDTGGQDDATGWLAAFLGPCPRWSTDVHEAREAAGISEKKLKGAKRRLNVESARVGADGPWFMRLPQHAEQVPEGTDRGAGEGQEAHKSPASDHWTSGTSGSHTQKPENPSTSQDSQRSLSTVLDHVGISGPSAKGSESHTTTPLEASAPLCPRPGPCGECRAVPCRCETPQQPPPASESQVERHTKFAALKANLVPPSPDEKDNGHARPKAHDRCGAV